MERDPRFLKLLCLLAVIEALTFIMLIGVAVPLKYFEGYSAGVAILGPIHGIVWLSYIWVVLATASLKMWKKLDIFRLVINSALPFGGFATAEWIGQLSTRKS